MDGVNVGLLAYLDQLDLGYVLQGMFNVPTLDSYIIFSRSFDSATGSRVEENFRKLTSGILGTDTHPWPGDRWPGEGGTLTLGVSKPGFTLGGIRSSFMEEISSTRCV